MAVTAEDLLPPSSSSSSLQSSPLPQRPGQGSAAFPSPGQPSSKLSGDIKAEDLLAPSDAGGGTSMFDLLPGSNVRKAEKEYGGTAGTDFLKGAGKTVKEAAAGTLEHPLNTFVGATKALTSGLVSMAEAAHQGIAGLAGAMGPEGFAGGQALAASQDQYIRDVTAKATGINLAPANKQEESMQELLGLIPGGLHAVGETAYEKTGSAFLGAAAEGFGTLLLLKPSVVSESLAKVKVKGSAEEAAFDKIAAENPTAAGEVADHVAPVDPQLAAYMKSRVNKFVKASEKDLNEIGRKRVEAELNPPDLKAVVKGLKKEPAKPDANALLAELDKTKPEGEASAGTGGVTPEVADLIDAKVPQDIGKVELDTAGKKTYIGLGYHKLPELWAKLNDKMQAVYKDALGSKENAPADPYKRPAMGTHEFLDEAIAAAPHPAIKSLLEAVRAHAEDVPIVLFPVGHERMIGKAASYNRIDHTIRAVYEPGDVHAEFATNAILHEVVHSATNRFIEYHPDHPAVIRLNELYNEAVARADRMAKANGVKEFKQFYGLADVNEFVSEALANPTFKKFLALSEDHASPGWKSKTKTGIIKDLYNQIASMLGVEGSKAGTLCIP